MGIPNICYICDIDKTIDNNNCLCPDFKYNNVRLFTKYESKSIYNQKNKKEIIDCYSNSDDKINCDSKYDYVKYNNSLYKKLLTENAITIMDRDLKTLSTKLCNFLKDE